MNVHAFVRFVVAGSFVLFETARADVIPVGPPLMNDVVRYTDVAAVPGGFIAAGVERQALYSPSTAVAQRFDTKGSAIAGKIVLDAADPDFFPELAAARDGSWIATWETGAPSYINPEIFARRFGVNDAPLGDAFQVNTHTTDWQVNPDVAVSGDGSFLIVWQSSSGPVDVFGQRYGSDGSPIGPETRLSESSMSAALRPAVAALADGAFVVTWVHDFEIRARRVLPGGIANDETPLVDNMAQNRQQSVSAFGDGFVVAWPAYVDYQHGDLDTDVWAARFDDSDSTPPPSGPISAGVSGTRSRSFKPSVASDGSGFVVVWSSANYYEGYDGQFGDLGPMRLNGARMNAEGSRTDDFDISPDDVADLRRPRVAMHRDGTFMVVWRSQDAGYSRVFCDTAGRRLGCGTSRCLSLPRSAGVVDITATDALAILAAAAGATSCPRCVCDVDSSGEVVATDASTALLRSVGLDIDLICPAC